MKSLLFNGVSILLALLSGSYNFIKANMLSIVYFLLSIFYCLLSTQVKAQEPPHQYTQTLWKFKNRGGVLSSPLLANGSAYFGTYNKYLYAVDMETGQEKWRFKTKNNVGYRPAIEENMVYCASYGDYIYALDIKTGQEKWKFKTRGGALSSPVIAGDVVYFGSYDKYLYALDVKSGQQKWKFKTSGGIISSIVIDKNVIYFGTNGKYLYAVDINMGKEIWKFKLHDNIRHTPIIADDMIYFGSYDKYLYAFNIRNKKIIWKFKTKGGVLSSPVIANGVVYFSSHGKYLYAVDMKTSLQLWKFKTSGEIVSSPAISNDVVYFGVNSSKYLYALDAKTGQIKWKYRTKGGILSSPAISEGVIYFGSFDKNLYALQRISLINIFGKITNAATGKPVNTDITVRCLDNNEIIGFAKNNPENGNYIITFLDTMYCHQYKLLASDPILFPDSIVIDIFEVAGRKDLSFDLNLIPISGKAINMLTGEPVETEITVKCLDNDQILGVAKTNAKDGSYNITIASTKDCFKYVVIASDTTLFPDGLIIDIFEIAERKDLTFDLKIIPISGKATNVLTGEAIETEISVRCVDNDKIIGVVKTNPDDGSYNFLFTTSGDCFKYEVLATDTTLFPGGLYIESFDLHSKMKNLDFNLSLISISGKVENIKNKEPVETEVTVICLENGEVVSITKTRIADGSYNLTFAHEGDCYKYSILATDTAFFPVSLSIDLTNKAQLKDLSFDLTLVPIEIGQTMRLNSIFYHTGKANLSDASLPELDRVLKLMQDYSTISIEVSGHTDNVGSDASNLKLSQKRAQAVADHLNKNEIAKERTLVKGYGETKPVTDNDTEKGRRMNRRVEFTILKK